MRYTRHNEFAIVIPVFLQSEIDIRTDTTRISSDVIGMSNKKSDILGFFSILYLTSSIESYL